MSFFSFLRKDQQESSAHDSGLSPGTDEASQAVQSEPDPGKQARSVDPILAEKKRARRRLIGAVALVLAVIIGLPMFLDHEPRSLSEDISVQISSRNPSQGASKAKSKSTLEKKETVVQIPSVPPVPVDGGKTATLPAQDVKPVAKTPAVAAKPAMPPPVAKANPPKPARPQAAEAARARAILEGRQPTVTQPVQIAAAGSGKVVLQVAALSSQGSVLELQKKLQAAGLKSYTQKISTAAGERIRVRVGPFVNAQEAEKAHAKLRSIGLDGTMTAH